MTMNKKRGGLMMRSTMERNRMAMKDG